MDWIINFRFTLFGILVFCRLLCFQFQVFTLHSTVSELQLQTEALVPSPPPSAMLAFVRHKLFVIFNISKGQVGDQCAGSRKFFLRVISVAPLKNMWYCSNSETFPATFVDGGR